MPHRNTPAPARIGRHVAEMSFAVPQVVAHRLLRMAAAGPSPSGRDRKEFALMGNEKMLAFFQSWGAMWLQLVRIQASAVQGMAAMAWTPLLGRRGPSDLSRIGLEAPARLMAAGLAPVHAKATANARCLSRARR